MEGLDYRDILSGGRPVNGWRDQRKNVVAVYYVRMVLTYQRAYFAVGCAVPYRLKEEGELGDALHLVVVALVSDDGMASGFQHCAFVVKNAVFTTGLLVAAVEDKDCERGGHRVRGRFCKLSV